MKYRVLAALAAVFLLLAGCGGEEEVPTISFGSHAVPVLAGVPVNEYDAVAFSSLDGVVTYDSKYARSGVDVSSYQQAIDWRAVKEDGVDFAIIRAGYRGYGAEGLLHEDGWFRQNMEGALSAGLHVGVYFFSQALTVEEAREEARFCLSLLAPYEGELTYPVLFDWETVSDPEGRSHQLDRTLLTDLALAFCGEMEAAGLRTGVYFNRELGYLSYDLSRLTGYDLWLAELSAAPTFYYDFQVWQYSHSGTVAGIAGSVDRNISFGGYDTGRKQAETIRPDGA